MTNMRLEVCTTREDSRTESLRHLADALAPGGFLLLAEATGPLACLLWGLDARCWRATDERDWGLWVSIARWRRLLAAAGLRIIVEHRCKHCRT